MPQRFENTFSDALTWLTVTVLGGAFWLVRRIFTNDQKIQMLQAEMDRREKQRVEDREQVADIKRSVERIEGWVVISVNKDQGK